MTQTDGRTDRQTDGFSALYNGIYSTYNTFAAILTANTALPQFSLPITGDAFHHLGQAYPLYNGQGP